MINMTNMLRRPLAAIIPTVGVFRELARYANSGGQCRDRFRPAYVDHHSGPNRIFRRYGIAAAVTGENPSAPMRRRRIRTPAVARERDTPDIKQNSPVRLLCDVGAG
jgi:hypothetical protein